MAKQTKLCPERLRGYFFARYRRGNVWNPTAWSI